MVQGVALRYTEVFRTTGGKKMGDKKEFMKSRAVAALRVAALRWEGYVSELEEGPEREWAEQISDNLRDASKVDLKTFRALPVQEGRREQESRREQELRHDDFLRRKATTDGMLSAYIRKDDKCAPCPAREDCAKRPPA